FSSRRRHTRFSRDWSSDVCSSDLVACYLCAAACPSDCIYIEAETDPRPYEERIGRDERYAKVYNIDYGRCIFCGFCVEACPKDRSEERRVGKEGRSGWSAEL